MQHPAETLVLTEPNGGFEWKPAWRKQLPIVRGVHAPKVSAEQALAQAPRLVESLSHGASAQTPVCAALLGAYLGNTHPDYLHQALSTLSITANLQQWSAYFAQACASTTFDAQRRGNAWQYHPDAVDKARAKAGYSCPLRWLVQQCVAAHGLVFTLQVSLDLWAQSTPGLRQWWCRELLAPLRLAIATANPADYNAALALVEPASRQSADLLRLSAHLFAHRGEWAAQWLSDHPTLNADHPEYLLIDCVLPAPAFARYVAQHLDLSWTSQLPAQSLLGALLLQLQLHNEATFTALALLLDQALARDAKGYDNSAELTLLLSLLSRLRVPQLPAALMQGVATPKVRNALEKLAQTFAAPVLAVAMAQTLAGRNRATECWTLRLCVQHPAAVASALATLPLAPRARFNQLLALRDDPVTTPPDLPPILREPPWLQAGRPGQLPAFDLPVLPTPPALVWAAGHQSQAGQHQPSNWRSVTLDAYGFPTTIGLTAAGAQCLLQGGHLAAGDIVLPNDFDFDDVLRSPQAAQLALWCSLPSPSNGNASSWSFSQVTSTMLAHHGTVALPPVLRFLTTHHGKSLGLASMIDSPDLVEHMLFGLRNVRLHKAGCGQWVAKFARTVIFKALPKAFAKAHSTQQDDARHGCSSRVIKRKCTH